MLFEGVELEEDLKFFNVKDAQELDTYDRRIFKTESQAETYLTKYAKTLKSLDNDKICHSRDLPAMLYKRRYMIQTILGEKNKTVRSYCKNWKAGQLFNLHDQTFFLTVRLKRIFQLSDGDYQYDFELP